MKARNTVMSVEIAKDLVTYEEMALLGQSDLISELVGSIQKRTAKAQAEITWDKAMREVIKYLVSDDNGLRIEIRGHKWGKQLKEWGA